MNRSAPFVVSLSLAASALIAQASPAAADAGDRVATAAASTAPGSDRLTAVAPPPAERRHSLNGNPWGFLFGSYGVTYEYLSGSHGMLVEGGFAHSGGASASATSGGGSVGYRWHWRGRQNSGFLGANLGFYAGTAQASVDDGSGSMERFDISMKTLQAVINIGKRWQFDSGLNITFRIGGGRAQRWLSTESTDPEAQQAVEDVQDLLDFIPIAVDGELSLGYSF